MLYPLSDEGASARPTRQRVSTRTRACQPVPTRVTYLRSGPRSNGTHRSPRNRLHANRCRGLPAAANLGQRLTEQPKDGVKGDRSHRVIGSTDPTCNGWGVLEARA